MSGNKNPDGLHLGNVIRTISDLGINLRSGSSHDYVALFPGLRSCPIDTSTHIKHMVVPWLAEATGYDRKKLYASLRSGKFDE